MPSGLTWLQVGGTVQISGTPPSRSAGNTYTFTVVRFIAGIPAKSYDRQLRIQWQQCKVLRRCLRISTVMSK
ncbi:MAG: hypothetical protein DRP63_07200 [Planctomycetota bacterium]|nr:MAG: hypothetical protein DRP63_07200 [Planctomycetota bacterium]